MSSIWNSLDRPLLVLAPMEDVTDTVFRRVINKAGKPDLYFTEFTSVEGLDSAGYEKVAQRLLFTKSEHPIIAQIWGKTPERFEKAARQLRELGFDGIDLNMGCPERSVVKQGACSALIKNPSLAKEIIHATREGAGDIPVSIKTRIGFSGIQTEEWIGFLLGFHLPALTIHARTVKEQSMVPAHWEEIEKAVELKDSLSPETLIIGNGDVKGKEEAYKKCEEYGCDGVMIGRGIFENPWLFGNRGEISSIGLRDRMELLLYHLDLFEQTWGGKKNFVVLKKYFKIYTSHFENAAEIRREFMGTNTIEEARILARKYRDSQVGNLTIDI